MTKKEFRVGIEVHKLDHVIRRTLSANVKEAGIDEITMMHGWIIRYLYEHRDQDIFQKDIEQHFAVGRSSVTNTIQLMEKKGYVTREFVEHDARLKKVLLTEVGLKTHEEIESLVNKVDEGLLRGVSKEELDVFLQVIDKIKANVGKERQDDTNTIEACKTV
ncbi:MAG: MarR family winged helix-turn-helix transcriptional regulator [Dorea sp.]